MVCAYLSTAVQKTNVQNFALTRQTNHHPLAGGSLDLQTDSSNDPLVVSL